MTVTIAHSTAWLLLFAAGILEIVWAVSMKASDGFSRTPYTVLTFVAAALSFWLLGASLKALPVGTAYAVWTGIGAVGAAALGIALFNEPANATRLGCIALVVVGVLGLKFTSGQA